MLAYSFAIVAWSGSLFGAVMLCGYSAALPSDWTCAHRLRPLPRTAATTATQTGGREELELGRGRMPRGGASLSAFVCQSAVLLGQPSGGACSAVWLPRNACMSCVVLESCSSFSLSTASSCEISCSMSTREPCRRAHGTIIYCLMHMLITVCIRTLPIHPLVNPVHSNSESLTLLLYIVLVIYC